MTIFNKTSIKIAIIVSIAVTLYSCNGSKTVIRPGDTIQEAFIKANRLFEMKRYSSAATAFETVISIGRGTEFGREAQFKLAESYFNDERYLLAEAEYKRFRDFYPRAEKVDIADFKRAVSYYKMSPRYKLDQTNSEKAIELFNLYISRYPQNSAKIQEADGYIRDLRNKMAHKNFAAAQLYFRLEQYEAAAIYYDVTINNYPDSKWAEQALSEQINTYVLFANRSIASKQEERYRKAIESYEKYLQLFPRGEHREKAEEYYEVALEGLESIGVSNDNQTVSNN